jgi:hypothetical protein
MGAELERLCGGDLPADHTQGDHVAPTSHAGTTAVQNGSATASA